MITHVRTLGGLIFRVHGKGQLWIHCCDQIEKENNDALAPIIRHTESNISVYPGYSRTEGNVANGTNQEGRYPQSDSLWHFAEAFHPTFWHRITTMPSISGSVQIGPWTKRRGFIPHSDHDFFLALCPRSDARVGSSKCEGLYFPVLSYAVSYQGRCM